MALCFVGTVLAQSPFPGASVLPGTLEFEHYDVGSAGLAYFDTTPGNSAGGLRSDDVDVSADANASGGFVVSSAAPGDWMRFTRDVSLSPERSFANLRIRYSANYEKQIRILQDNVLLASPVLAASANGTTFTLEKLPMVSGTGRQIRVEVLDSGGNALFSDKSVATTAEQWDVLDGGVTGAVAFRSVLNGRFLRVTSKDHSIFAASNAVLGNQERFEVGALGSDRYSLRSFNSNTFMSATSATASVGIKSTAVTGNAQRFLFEDLGPAPGISEGVFPVGRRIAIRSVQANRYLSIANDPNLRLDSMAVEQWVNRVPVVTAGDNRTLAWPTASVSLNGTAQELDPTGSLTDRGWVQISGPSQASLSGLSTTVTGGVETTRVTVSALQRGVYVFEFYAVDDLGDRSSSRVEVAVIDESQHTLVPPVDSRIAYFGRVHGVGSLTPQFGWSGAGIRIRFEGTSLSLKLTGGGWPSNKQSFYILLNGDDENPRFVDMGNGDTVVHVASGLPFGIHTVELYSLSGAWVAPTTFGGVLVGPGGSLLSPPAPSSRRIEFYGDSITEGAFMAGYDYTNTYRAFAATAARRMGADAHILSKSGLGLVMTGNSGGSTLEGLYWRSLPWNSTQAWNFQSWVPQVIVINILQNDKWLQGSTPDQTFIDAYLRFLRLLRTHRPYAHIVCALGSMDATSPGSKWPGLVQTVVDRMRSEDRDQKVHTLFFGYLGSGTGHPNEAQAAAMADVLKAFLDGLPGDVWTSGAPASSGYQAWARAHYPLLHASEAQPGAANPAGLSNLLSYSSGGDPLAGSQVPVAEIAAESPGGMVFRFRAAAPELVYEVRMSPSLAPGSWETVEWPVIDDGNGWRSVLVPAEFQNRVFLQLQVRMN
ncbi:MAG: hypothetical protein SFU53_16330 [Terrimicrobiaceae bacterium]|nr:hypothetical protein [Terrimicrobiaceae bacterium]